MYSMQELERLEKMLMCDEGVAFKPYRCTSGKLTTGVGRNLNQKGLNWAEIKFQLENDIMEFYDGAKQAIRNMTELCWERQMVIVNMAFTLGIAGLRSFKNMIAAVEALNFKQAATEILDSKYAKEDVPNRAKRNAYIMEHGDIPKDWYREYKIID